MTGTPPRLDDAYRIELLADSGVTPDDVLALWAREAGIADEEAVRRLPEVLMVGVHQPTGALAGVSTAWLHRPEQLRMDIWWFRALVAAEHRRSQVARFMMKRGVAYLEHRFVSGEDRRGSGVGIVVQNADLERERRHAIMPVNRLRFIGETPRGSLMRVLYFPGAEVPLPS